MSNNNKQNLFAIFGVLFSASCWGIIWYPYRLLDEAGLSGVASSFYSYLIAALIGCLLFGRYWRHAFDLPKRAYWLCLIAGWTNLSFVLAMIDGEVMRVMLLFYLSPLWTLLLAKFFLKERIPARGLFAIVLSLIGAAIMLTDFDNPGLPLPQNNAEWLALSSGIGFSMANVFTRHANYLDLPAKCMLVWVGVVGVCLLLTPVLGAQIPLLDGFSKQDWLVLIFVALMLVLATLGVQYGVTKLTAIRASVLFLFELIVAAIAAYFLAHEAMTWHEWVGGLLIVIAGLISATYQPQTIQA